MSLFSVLPTATSSSPLSPIPSAPAQNSGLPVENTLDESVWATFKRDIVAIGRNLWFVVFPIRGRLAQQQAALKNWDLWGPLIFLLALCITVSWNEKAEYRSNVFALIFVEIGLGALVLTANVILLGGEIVFFQSLCLLGYCLFPIEVAAIICSVVSYKIVRTVVLILCLGWASVAAVPFIGSTVPEKRKALAIYPVLLMYISVGWLVLMMS